MEELVKCDAQVKGLRVEIDRQSLAMSLKTWRIRQNLTQQQVGDRWGVTRYVIIKAERAKPISWEAAYRIFAALSDELRKEAANGQL